MHRYLLLTLLTLAASQALAADMEEVVVTADFRHASALDVPGSVSVTGADKIASRAAEHFEDIALSIPNVNFAGGTGRARFFQIRGIGERSQFADPVNPSVGVLIDGVDFSGAGSAATLLDVRQVEVLRGPQGTRYGANALAGLINIITEDPQTEPDASVDVGTGRYGTARFSGMATGPLTGTLSGRIAAEHFEGDGYTYNAFLDRHDVNYRNENTLRGKLLLVPSDRIRVKATLFGANVDDGYDAFSLDNTRTTLSDQPGRDKQASRALAIDTLVHTSAADVNFIVSAMDTDSIYGYDEDWTYVGIHPDGYSSTDYYFRHRKSWSAELRALSNSSNRIWDDSTDWLVGLYTLSSKEDLLRRYTYLSGDFNSDYDFVTTAAFAQFDTHLTDRLSLSSGARLERRDTHYTDSAAVAFDPVDNLWGVNIALQFQRGAFMSWASIARGYKAGGFNTDGSLDADLRSFGPEYLWEIEVGTKGIIADNLQLQASLFYDLRRDQQVKSSVVRVRADGSTEFIDFFGNAASGTNLGAELEVDFYPTETLGLNMSLGLLKATFDNYINEFGEDLSGRDQAQAPRYTASVSADYRRGGWFVRAGVDARDRFYFSDRHNLRGNAYALVNASAGYEADHWTIRLWGRNLTNRDYYVRGFGSFGNDPRNGYAVEPYLQFGEPRVLGIDFEYRMR